MRPPDGWWHAADANDVNIKYSKIDREVTRSKRYLPYIRRKQYICLSMRAVSSEEYRDAFTSLPMRK